MAYSVLPLSRSQSTGGMQGLDVPETIRINTRGSGRIEQLCIGVALSMGTTVRPVCLHIYMSTTDFLSNIEFLPRPAHTDDNVPANMHRWIEELYGECHFATSQTRARKLK